MNLLITGTDGFVGSNLKEYFVNAGFRVHGTVYNRAPLSNESAVDIRSWDEFDPLRGREFPVIIHTAGIVDQNAPKKLIYQVNTLGTKNLLSFAQHAGCRHFIQMSSVSVYGPKTLGQNRSEDTKRNFGIFSLPYMKSKAMAEECIEESKVPYTLLRLPPVVGKNDSYLSTAIIPRLISGTFYFCGQKKRMISILCVKNLGPIIHRIIETGPLYDAVHCVDFQVSWDELVAEYAKKCNVPVPKSRRSVITMLCHFKDKKYVLMISFSYFGAHYKNEKLLSKISFTPQCKWQDAVEDAVTGYLHVHACSPPASS